MAGCCVRYSGCLQTVDGLAMCAIIHAHRPDLINFSALKSEEGIDNLQLAFDVAHKEFDVAKLLDAEDIVQIPEERSIMTYLAQVYFASFH